jgi:hypothetical protein
MPPRFSNRANDIANLYDYLDMPDDKYKGLYQAQESRLAESQWPLLQAMHDLRPLLPLAVDPGHTLAPAREEPRALRAETAVRVAPHSVPGARPATVSPIGGADIRRNKAPVVAPLAQFIAPKGRSRTAATHSSSPADDEEGVPPLPKAHS